MSLINEALKRAKQLQEPGSTAAGLDLRPAAGLHQPDGGTGVWLPVLTGVVFTISAVLLWQWLHAGAALPVRARTPAAEVKVATTAAPAISTPAPAQEKAPAQVVTPAPTIPAPAELPGSSDKPLAAAAAINTPATTNLAVIEPPKPPPVTYKLQSLFYRPKNPAAVINGKTVFVGDRVGEARVVAMTPDAVTIVTASGQTNLLELP